MASSVTRDNGNNIVIIIRKQADVVPLPTELQGVISADKWDSRLEQARALCNSYGKPMFERIFFVVATLAIIITPVSLNHVIFNAITPKAIRDAFYRQNDSDFLPSNRFDGDLSSANKYIADTRLINTAIMIGLVLAFWGPMIFWKWTGNRRARTLVARWAVEDGAQGASFVPRYTISPPGIWTIYGAVRVTTPPTAPPTLFNPMAYIPQYVVSQPGQGPYFQPPVQQIPYNPQYQPQPPTTAGVAQQQWAAPIGPPPQMPPRRPAPPAENPFTDFEKTDSMDEKHQEFDDVKL